MTARQEMTVVERSSDWRPLAELSMSRKLQVLTQAGWAAAVLLCSAWDSTSCLASGCPNKDELSHIVECSGYVSRPEEGAFEGDDEKLATYLDQVDSERFRSWRAPLLFRRSMANSGKAPKNKVTKVK